MELSKNRIACRSLVDFSVINFKKPMPKPEPEPEPELEPETNNITMPITNDNTLSFPRVPDGPMSMMASKIQPTDYLEYSIGHQLDRTFNSVKRRLTRDITSSMKTNGSPVDTNVVSSFLLELTAEISEIFEVPSSHNTSNETKVITNVVATFDENTKPIHKLFKEAEDKRIKAKDKRVQELTDIWSSVNELKTAVKGITDTALEQVEKHRFEISKKRDEAMNDARNLDRKARNLQRQYEDLQSRLGHQKSEELSLERLTKQLHDKRHKFQQSQIGPSEELRNRLQEELSELKSELENDAAENLSNQMKECLATLANIRDELREELASRRVTYRHALTPNPKAKYHPMTNENISPDDIIQRVQEKLLQSQTQRAKRFGSP